MVCGQVKGVSSVLMTLAWISHRRWQSPGQQQQGCSLWAAQGSLQCHNTHLCVCTAQIAAYLHACCSRNHFSPQKCFRAELGKLSAPGFHCTVLSRQQGGAEGSNLNVLLSVDSPPRKFITKHHDRESQKRRCDGLENMSTGNKILIFYLFYKTHGCVGELGLKSTFSSLSEESPSGTPKYSTPVMLLLWAIMSQAVSLLSLQESKLQSWMLV